MRRYDLPSCAICGGQCPALGIRFWSLFAHATMIVLENGWAFNNGLLFRIGLWGKYWLGDTRAIFLIEAAVLARVEDVVRGIYERNMVRRHSWKMLRGYLERFWHPLLQIMFSIEYDLIYLKGCSQDTASISY